MKYKIMNGKAVFPKGIKEIEPFAFKNCTDLREVEIPEGVEIIWNCAFSACRNLRKVILPKSLRMIRRDAFWSCASLEEIQVPEGVDTIEEYAFSRCRNLKKVTLPNTLQVIGRYAFWCCDSLEEIQVPEGVDTIEEYAFSRCRNLKKVTLPNTLQVLGFGVFSYCGSLEKFQVPEGVKVIRNWTFECCQKLKMITIAGSPKIQSHAFDNCTELTVINLHGRKMKVECIDGFCMELLSQKLKGEMEILHCKIFGSEDTVWIARVGDLAAHGITLKDAVKDLHFKWRKRDGVDKVIAKIKETNLVTAEDYRLITGACRQGTQQFLDQKGYTWEDAISIEEALQETKSFWGHETFQKYFV